MKQEEISKLLELYEQGLTSSEEEAALLRAIGKSTDENHKWFNYLNQNIKSVPKNLESNIWSDIQSQEKKKSRFILRAISVAASITLVISVLWITNPFKPKEMSYEEKSMVLKEVLLMFSTSQETQSRQEIIYEDETIIIYNEKIMQ